MNINLIITVLYMLFSTMSISQNIYASSFGMEKVKNTLPESYKKWLPWIMLGHENLLCPQNYLNQTFECLLYGPFSLNLNQHGGSFLGSLEVYSHQMVPIPGSEKSWPTMVKTNGIVVPVTLHHGNPAVFLEPGVHSIEGIFQWTSLPNSLKLPNKLYFIKLFLNDSEITSPKVDSNSEIWLNTSPSVEDMTQNTYNFDIHRLYNDTIPAILNTSISLKISGQSRDIILGQILPDGFSALSIDSPLPTQWTSDGELKIRALAGQYTIAIVSKNQNSTEKIVVPKASKEPWPLRELWAINEDQTNRSLEMTYQSLDPSQTNFPKKWHKFPLFAFSPESEIQLNPKNVTTNTSMRDQIKLQRTLWLDSFGGQFTFKDKLTGELLKSWRLSMSPEFNLGKASVNSTNLMITQVAGKNGIEVRDVNVEIEAEGRIFPKDGYLGTTGWDLPIEQMSILLNIPPGWRILTVFGADSISRSWLKTWNLLNIFLLCLISLSAFKLFGPYVCLVSFLSILLLLPEDGSPKWIWFLALILAAFQKVLPPTTLFKNAVRYGQIITIITLFISLTSFSITHLKHAMHPVLEEPMTLPTDSHQLAELKIKQDHNKNFAKKNSRPDEIPVPTSETEQDIQASANTPQMTPPAPDILAPPPPTATADQEIKQRSYTSKVPEVLSKSPAGSLKILKQELDYYAQQGMTQTGYGVPNRTWNQYLLTWDGPVHWDQKFRLLLVTPLQNQVLAFIRVFLAGAMAYLFVRKGFFTVNDMRGIPTR